MNSRMQGFERNILLTIWQSKLLWLIHVVVNAALMIAFFYWLRIPEESALQLALAAGSGVLIAFVTLWLHSATFDYFQPLEHRLGLSLRRSVVCLPAFLIWVAIFGLGLWLIGQLWIYDQQAGGWIRHLLPGFLRKTVTPRSAMATTSWLHLVSLLFPVADRVFAGGRASRGEQFPQVLMRELRFVHCAKCASGSSISFASPSAATFLLD